MHAPPEVTATATTDAADDALIRALADQLLPAFYEDLRRLAHRERLHIGPAPTLGTTALVHEAYLRLRGAAGWHSDRHFLAAAALAMRHALINHVRARQAAKRGDGADHTSLSQLGDGIGHDDDEALLSLDAALDALAVHAPRLAKVVQCRYYAGYSETETARALGVSERTVRRDWLLAKAWLYREIQADPAAGQPSEPR